MSSLFNLITVGSKSSGNFTLDNRIVMGALTRNRCVDDLKPGPAQVRHYAERARYGAGLIISEATLVDWSGTLWPNAPVMINEDHAAAWRNVVDAVHAAGGRMYLQALHVGRVQNDQDPLMQRTGTRVLAPSNIPVTGGKYRHIPGDPGHTRNLKVIDDPRTILETYRNSITLAKSAGFDGVELHAGGGYLPHQFLNASSNHRTDAYGGSVANRCRFLLELVDVASQVYDSCPERICVKITPAGVYNDSITTYDEMQATYGYLIPELLKRKIGIVCISRHGAHFDADLIATSGVAGRPKLDKFALPDGYDPVLDFGRLVKFEGSPTLLMANQGYTPEEGARLVAEGKIDLFQIGRAFIYNPDLVARIRHGVPLATNGRGSSVAYGPFETPDENYNDWPVATEVPAPENVAEV
ncbi:uncharacterized protein B0I36DRAFT_255799 [Microdochium trichocladiopsis]|uniref:NADH:flavin oxidoreductase/NADH oxidase N-terminal domain-containing protein n=1 Tax=Microdochium trichocladiopsis TaxID=1682393 RepID=A0A9P8XSH7_9PEZI|nr:uncharacterized protein B0I36DRAFT_255799 [Microdochium trichocladiopsis]KAH7014587.1 hypothetical protein B0I36DRAFT_255799 [Microdochium trichocladiopsis]